jgi:hypothetical protein
MARFFRRFVYTLFFLLISASAIVETGNPTLSAAKAKSSTGQQRASQGAGWTMNVKDALPSNKQSKLPSAPIGSGNLKADAKFVLNALSGVAGMGAALSDKLPKPVLNFCMMAKKHLGTTKKCVNAAQKDPRSFGKAAQQAGKWWQHVSACMHIYMPISD